MLKFSLNKQTNKPKKKKKVRLEHPQQMCQVPNIWHTKHKKHLPSNVLYVPNFYHLCPYYCKFATVWTQMPNRKILFYSTFLSPLISLFDFFSLFLESVSLSQVPNSCSSSSHNRMQARRRRRRWPREEERQLQLRQNRRWQP